jgi:hypothetical protein
MWGSVVKIFLQKHIVSMSGGNNNPLTPPRPEAALMRRQKRTSSIAKHPMIAEKIAGNRTDQKQRQSLLLN